MSGELGFLFYPARTRTPDGQRVGEGMAQMAVKLLSEEDAAAYVSAKILTDNIEDEGGKAMPPAYFVPLSAFKPLDGIGKPLKPEDFEYKTLAEAASEQPCGQPGCIACNDSLQEHILQHPDGEAFLQGVGIDTE